MKSPVLIKCPYALLKELFAAIPPDLQQIRDELYTSDFTQEELAKIAIDLTDNCFAEYAEVFNSDDVNIDDIEVDAKHSFYLIESLQILLDYGLDPNMVIDDENAMWNTQWIDAPYVGAAALRLLLEYGGDPNHRISDKEEALFDYVAFKVSYDQYSHRWFHTVQCWLVLMAFGGCWSNGSIPLTMLGDNKVEIFKSFEDFDYTIEPRPQKPGKYGCWTMHIFRLSTGEEVARYK